jgi:adenylate kinase
MNIVLLGPPGAGKGTQAVLLAKHKHVPHISTGEIMREAVASGSELGSKVKGYLDKGDLVPDKLVIDLVRDRLSRDDCKIGFLLDGFPRTVDQAKALVKMLSEIHRELTHVVDLVVADKVLVDRIQKRGAQGSGRSDDTAEVAMKRLEIYKKQTAPVSDYFRTVGKVIDVDGIGSIEDVEARILAACK